MYKPCSSGNKAYTFSGTIRNIYLALLKLNMDRPINCVIVDDNKVARMLLQQILVKIDNIVIIGEFDDPLKAKTYIENNAIDILFLDIEMPGLSGLELLRML